MDRAYSGEENSERTAVIARSRNEARRERAKRGEGKERAMTASLEGRAKSVTFAVRSRGAGVATKKFNVFAEIGRFTGIAFEKLPKRMQRPGRLHLR